MKRCPYCDEEVQDNAIKCKHCGSMLTSIGNAVTISSRQISLQYDTLDSATTVDGKATVLANQYRVIKKIGEGGMGVVYLAEDIEMQNRPVAIKVLPPLLSKNVRAVENLRKEAITAINLNHPNIIRLYGFHSDGEIKFLVMEYIDGQTLEEKIAKSLARKLSLDETISIVEKVAAALDYAHNRKPPVFHRDLKPSNIMISKKGEVKLLDFGIAREIHDSYTTITGKADASGTPPYMSPEQVRGQRPSASMDIYSFGVVIYECLSGRRPFYTGDIRYQIINEKPALVEDIADCVNNALQKALAKDSSDRPKTARQLVTLITRVFTDKTNLPRRKIDIKPLYDIVGNLKNLWFIGVLFIVMTVFVILVGYWIASYTNKSKEMYQEKTSEDSQKALTPFDVANLKKVQQMDQRAACAVNLKSIVTAMMMYSMDHRERWPSVSKWCDILSEYANVGKHAFKCPSASKGPCNYAMNKYVEKLGAVDIPADMVLLFEAEPGWNQAGGPELLSTANHNGEGCNIAFGDGQVKFVRKDEFKNLIWTLPQVNSSKSESSQPQPNAGDIITNSIGMKLVYIPAGEFMMGSPSNEKGRESDEGPQHKVTISKGFYVSIYEVTQIQYLAVMGTNPSYFKGDNNPVEQVSWNDATEFCHKLSLKESKTYRLPTEAEWEYACRAGTTTTFYFGETINTDQANYDGNYTYGNEYEGIDRQKTIAVGSFSPNVFGLYDMYGNVCEWCKDWYDKDYYSNSPSVDPQGPASGEVRVLRGGYWYRGPLYCRSASRDWNSSDSRGSVHGFRVVREAGE